MFVSVMSEQGTPIIIKLPPVFTSGRSDLTTTQNSASGKNQKFKKSKTVPVMQSSVVDGTPLVRLCPKVAAAQALLEGVIT